MANFDMAFHITLAFEGGYVNNPTDPGGETNKGITMKTFSQSAHTLLGLEPTSAHLKALTDGQAGIIYKHSYWAPIHGDDIECQDLANILFDFYVNAGSHATFLLQQVLKDQGQQIAVDGCIGKGTLKALHALPQQAVYSKYKAGRIDYYTKLGERFPQFLKGWLHRVNSFPDMQEEAVLPAVTAAAATVAAAAATVEAAAATVAAAAVVESAAATVAAATTAEASAATTTPGAASSAATPPTVCPVCGSTIVR